MGVGEGEEEVEGISDDNSMHKNLMHICIHTCMSVYVCLCVCMYPSTAI